MGLRPLLRGIAALLVVSVVLLLVSVVKESLARSERVTSSTFIPLIENEALQPKDVSKIEVSLPEGNVRWSYERIDGLWRLPDFAGVYAQNGEVDNLIKMLSQSRARPVGDRSEDEARFGLLPNSVLTITLFQEKVKVVTVKIGALVPGAAKDERYILRDNDDAIYLLNSNPGSIFLDSEPPVMVDKNILPRVFPHGIPARISYSGSRRFEVKELEIKQLPVDPNKRDEPPSAGDKEKKREPTHEFIGTLATGAKKMFDDGDGMLYVNQLLGTEFDKIVGSISPAQVEYRKFDQPIIEVTLHYDSSPSIVLAVSDSLIEGRYPILNRSTGQMFIIASEKVEALTPKLKAKEAE